MTISHEQAVEIDTQLADIWTEQNKAVQTIQSNRHDLARAIGLEEKRRGGPYGERYYSETTDEVLHLAAERLLDMDGYRARGARRHYEAIVEALDTLETLRAEAAPLEALYSEHQWSRFFLVNNSNGHIHSSMRCHTCNIETSFSWLPTLSGLTEADAVEAHGSILCTVCYPSAPVEWTNGISKADQAARDERAAAKAERDAAKAAKAITAPDGSPLLDGYGSVIRTEVSARREMSDAFSWLIYNEKRSPDRLDLLEKYTQVILRMSAALAAKTGEDVDQIVITARAKAEKKYAKEMSR